MSRLHTAFAATVLMTSGAAFAEPTLLNNDTWVETFDCYPDGLDLHDGGMGVDPNPNGWKAWDSESHWTAYVRLCDGEPDEPPAAHSGDYALEVVSWNVGVVYTDIVREFSRLYEAYDAGRWLFTTHVYVPADLDGSAYFVMLNQYVDHGQSQRFWSVQMMFDPWNDVVEAEYGDGTLPLIYDQWVPIEIEIDLDNDWHRVYYGNDLLYAKPWTASPENTGLGFTAIAAVDLYSADNTVPIYFDTMRLTREPPPCAGDMNGDNMINTDDFLLVLSSWGDAGAPVTAYTQPDCVVGCGPFGIADVNEDCTVNTDDFLAVLASAFECPNLFDPQGGACCLPDMNCVETLTASECDLAGGVFHGSYLSCADVTCLLNDWCTRAAPLVIDDPLGCTLGSNVEVAMPEDDTIDDCFGAVVNGPGLWYTVVGNGNKLRVNTCNEGTAIDSDPGGGWETLLAMGVYCGACDFLNCVGGSDLACIPPGGQLPIDLVPSLDFCSRDGEIYYICVYGVAQLDRNTVCVSVEDFGDCGGTPPPICWCDIGLADTEGEETWVGAQYGTPGCYPDWDGVTPVVDGYNGGYFACPTPMISTQLYNGGTVVGSAGYYISPIDESDNCDGWYTHESYYLRDTDWYRVNVPAWGNGASIVITVEAECIAQITLWSDECKSDPPQSNLDDVMIRAVFTTADPEDLVGGGRCLQQQFVVDELWAGDEYLVSIHNIDDPKIACAHAQYELSISFGPVPPDYYWSIPDLNDATAVAAESDTDWGSIAGPVIQADDFHLDAPHVLNQVTYYGIHRMDNSGPAGYLPCTSPESLHDIRIWTDSDADRCPNTLLAEWLDVPTAPLQTAWDLFGFDVYFHVANLGPPIVLDAGVCYFLEVVGSESSSCTFSWISAQHQYGNHASHHYAVKYVYLDPPLATWDPLDPANWSCDPEAAINDFDMNWGLFGAGQPLPVSREWCICLP